MGAQWYSGMGTGSTYESALRMSGGNWCSREGVSARSGVLVASASAAVESRKSLRFIVMSNRPPGEFNLNGRKVGLPVITA